MGQKNRPRNYKRTVPGITESVIKKQGATFAAPLYRIAAALLCVAFILAAFPITVFATDTEFTINNALDEIYKIGEYSDKNYPVFLYAIDGSTYSSVNISKPTDNSYTSVYLAASGAALQKSIIYQSDEYNAGIEYYKSITFNETINEKLTSTNEHILVRVNKSGRPANGGGIKGYVIIEWEKPASADKTSLVARITEAESADASSYKTENDRYNARTKAVSANGFWSDFQAALTSAKSVNANTAVLQAQVDSALATLTDAMANLIPADQINPTVLYETIEQYKAYEDKLSRYTEKSANGYRTALAEANAYLASLFDESGDPAAENVNANQSKADGYADALVKATAELARMIDQYDHESLALDAIPTLCKLADEAADNTALNGRTVLKAARDAAYAVWQKYEASQFNLYASELKEITSAYLTLFDAYFLNLTNTADSITVNVRVTDSGSLENPNFYKPTDWTSTTWTGSVTLTDDQTLGALEAQLGEKLYNGGRMDGYGAVSYAAIINGIYANSLQWTDSSYFTDLSYDYESKELSYYSDRYILHDGDTVELVLLPDQQLSSYTGTAPLHINYTMRYMQTARFEQDGVPVTGTLTATEGEPMTLHVSCAYASLQSYTGTYSDFSGAELYVSAENSGKDAATAGDAAAPTFDTGYQTDANGDVTFTLYGSGWVHLYAADLSKNTGFYGNTDVSGGPQIEELPSMTAGASVWIYVNAKSGDELVAAIAELKQELDDNYLDIDRTLFTDEELKSIDDTYTESCEKFQTVDSLTDAKNLVREFDALVAQLVKKHQSNDYIKSDAISSILGKLPDNLEDFTQGFAERFRYLQTEMASATTHQINQMTKAKQAKYEQLVAAYGDDGSTLPAQVNPTVTVTVEGDKEYQEDFIVANDRSYPYTSSEYANDDSRVNVPGMSDKSVRKGAALGTFGATDYCVQEGSYYQLTIARKMAGSAVTCDYNAKVVKIEVLDKDTGKPIENATIGIYNYDDANWVSSRRHFYYEPTNTDFPLEGTWGMTAATVTVECVMPHNILVKVYLENVATPDELTEAKTELKDELTAAFKGYTKSNYSSANWNVLVTAYNEGLSGIEKAADVTAATTAKTNALAAMAAVTADMTQDYGTVYVTIENTTYTSDLWPEGKTYWEGKLIDNEPVTLTADSTMMSCIVAALTENGYEQTGAASNYISSINGLAQFDGGGQSGWMGMLNDWFTNEGFGNFSVANGKLGDGDEICIMYSMTGYGSDLGGSWSNQNTTLASLSVDGGDIFPEFTSGTLGSDNEFTLKINGDSANVKITPTAANKNFLVKIFLNEKVTSTAEGTSFYKRTQTIPVVAGDTLYVGCGVKGWPTMNAQGGNTQTANGTWYVLKVVNGNEDDGSAYVMELIDENCNRIPTMYNYKYVERYLIITRAAYESLSEDAKQNVTNYQKLVDAENSVASFKKTADLAVKIAALPSVYRSTLEDAEQIKSVQEIYESLTQEEKDRLTVNEYNKLMALIQKIDGLNQDAADKVMADIAAIGAVVLEDDCVARIIKARAGYDALNKYAQALVENLNTLVDAEAKLKELQEAAAEQERIDRAAAAAVDSLIDEIGDVTLESKQSIDTARAAYDSLTEKQRSYVTKLSVLTDAESTYKALVDQKAADDVMEKINAIDEVTLDSKTTIEAARSAYDALTDDQKALVTSDMLKKLTDAEAELARLEAEAKDKADREAAAQVDEMIKRLFPVDRYSGPAIRMARAAYDALTEDQKALVTR